MRISEPNIISAGNHINGCGQLEFINDFDISKIKRVYLTNIFYRETVRAWQGLKKVVGLFVRQAALL